ECGKGNGQVAEQDRKLWQVEGNDGNKQHRHNQGGYAHLPTRKQPQGKHYFEHVKAVQRDKRVNGEACNKFREVAYPGIWVVQRIQGRVKKGEGNTDAQEQVAKAFHI